MKKVILFLIITLGLFVFFSYHLTEIPDGINGDEASLGYNATLLSRNLRDETGRHYPVFMLVKEGADYLQPVPAYFMTLLVKLFGPSLYIIRMSSVITAVISVLLIYFLGKELLGKLGGLLAGILLATTPIIMIQSHLAFDNITPIPFVIGWLLTLFLYTKTKKKYFLMFSGVLLGISYYSFKSMRIFVPMWTVLTTIYLSEEFLTKISKKNFLKILIPVGIFTVSILPFYAVIPWLEFQYSGAVLNRTDPSVNNIYNFIYNYLANFDPSFLFIKGDELLTHSTRTHGMFLLSSLPFFIFGLIKTWSKNSFWKLMILSFFLGPVLFGYIGQVHRANRLLALIPLYSLISASGFLELFKYKSKIIIALLSTLFILNYSNFIRYYWNNFAMDTKNLYICFECKTGAFKLLKEKSVSLNKTPYVDHVLAKGVDPSRDFARSIYFTKQISTWNGEQKDYPDNSVLMTNNDNVSFLKKIDKYGDYYFYIK